MIAIWAGMGVVNLWLERTGIAVVLQITTSDVKTFREKNHVNNITISITGTISLYRNDKQPEYTLLHEMEWVKSIVAYNIPLKACCLVIFHYNSFHCK